MGRAVDDSGVTEAKTAIVEFATWLLNTRDIALSDVVSKLEEFRMAAVLEGVEIGTNTEPDEEWMT